LRSSKTSVVFAHDPRNDVLASCMVFVPDTMEKISLIVSAVATVFSTQLHAAICFAITSV